MFNLVDYRQIGKFATFSGNIKLPVYRWFYYKEGFSRDLIFYLLKRFNVKKNSLVLDPFCGSGTTILASKEFGVSAVGFDILPVSILSSRVKLGEYEISTLKKCSKSVLRKKASPEELDTHTLPFVLKRFFDSETAKRILFYKEKIDLMEDDSLKNFFTMALIRAAMNVTFAYKDGNVLKIKKRPLIPFKVALEKSINGMILDYKKFSKNLKSDGKAYVAFGNAKHMPLKSKSVDIVVTSPPYLRQTDYKRVYKIENFFVAKSYDVNAFIDTASPSSYFRDIENVLDEVYRVSKNGGKTAIIVGNAYLNKFIECDFVISEVAESIGFNVKNIFVLNERHALKDRTKKIGVLRESIIEMEKP